MRKGKFFRLMVLWFVAAAAVMRLPAVAGAWDGAVVEEHGNPANRVNTVFLGDGYQAHELSIFTSHINTALSGIFNKHPMNVYRNYFNIYKVNVISNQSGADNPLAGVYVDTALDTTFNFGGTDRCIYTNSYTKVYDAAADAPVAYTPGMLQILVNSSKYGGCAGSFAVTSTSSGFGETIIHEIGHSLGDLADEYFNDSSTYAGGEPRRANVTIQTIYNNIKWKHWINAATPLPTSNTGLIGIFEGGQYNKYGIYRPTFNSLMRELNRPFQEVNAEQMVLQIYNRVSPIDAVSPASPDVTVSGDKVFTVTPMQPIGHNMDVKWYFDGSLAGSGNTFTVTPGMVASGSHQLQVVVRDPTAIVRHDPNKLLEDSFTWTLSHSPNDVVAAVLLKPTPGTVIDKADYSFNWDTGKYVDEYILEASAAPAGGGAPVASQSVFYRYQGTQLSTLVSNIPLEGNDISVNLISIVNGGEAGRNSYTFKTKDTREITAKLTAPVIDTVINESSVDFAWDRGVNATEYWLSVATSEAKINSAPYGDIFSANVGSALSKTVSGIPLNGKPLYVRVWSKFNSSWGHEDYIFSTESKDGKPAVMTSPAPGATITSSTTFAWGGGDQVDGYYLGVGTTEASVRNAPYGDIFHGNLGTGLSHTVSGIPENGNSVYVLLWSMVKGQWISELYIYKTDAKPVNPAEITVPAAGAVINTSSVTFQWGNGQGVEQYWLGVGTTKDGTGKPSGDIYYKDQGQNTSVAVPGIPLSGANVYVRLWSKMAGKWEFKDYQYATEGVPAKPADLLSPAAGAVINSSNVTLQWGNGQGVSEYYVGVGTSSAAVNNSPYGDIYRGSAGLNESVTVTGVPLNGAKVYVKLWSKINGAWQHKEYSFLTEARQGSKPAEMISPVNGTKLTSSEVTFTWGGGQGIEAYFMGIGTTQASLATSPYGNLYAGSLGTKTSVTVTLTLNGQTIYVRLWSKVDGAWKHFDYTYQTEARSFGGAQISQPAEGSTLNSSSVTFSWQPVAGAQEYWLGVATSLNKLGTQPYGDIYAKSVGLATSATVSGIPLNGNGVYTRLWTKVNGQWLYYEQVFLTQGPPKEKIVKQ